MKIDQELVKRLFDYCPETGVLTHRYRNEARANWNTRYAGKPVGYVNSLGYVMASIYQQRISVHRIAWLWMTGDTPNIIDHVDQNTANNKWSNLRDTDHTGNATNTRIPKDNKTGMIGVRRHSNGRGFVAFIAINGKQRHLCYGDLIKCAAARLGAELEHGYHANHGSPTS